MRNQTPFDIGYALASVQLTNGNTVVATTAGDYHGFVILSSSASPTIKIFDSLTASGKLLDVAIIAATTNYTRTLFIPVKARLGIYVSITNGTGVQGTVFHAPKG